MNRELLIKAVGDAGVVGAGGAGFPTHKKLLADGIDTYLVNGIECEPLLEGDCYMMTHMADSLVSAAKAIEETFGVKALFCLKEKHKDACRALREAGADVFASKDYYPLGDEIILIYEALGRIVPEGKLPLHVGVIVNNVETLYNINEALQGNPVTHSFVWVGGAVRRSGLYRVPIGAGADLLIKAAGGSLVQDPVFIDGGPMMGLYYNAPDFPITKTTKGVLLLPSDSMLAKLERMPVETMLKQARVCCCQCNQCTVACSRNLVGFHIEPHKIMRAMAFRSMRNRDVLQMAMLCSECNLCSALHACPMGLNPKRVNQQIKRIFREQQITPQFNEGKPYPHPLRDYRLLPSSRLKERLGLIQYEKGGEFMGNLDVESVKIPLKQHVGKSAHPLVQTGDLVEAGDPIAEPFHEELGAIIHASIAGRVDSVTTDHVLISAQR